MVTMLPSYNAAPHGTTYVLSYRLRTSTLLEGARAPQTSLNTAPLACFFDLALVEKSIAYNRDGLREAIALFKFRLHVLITGTHARRLRKIISRLLLRWSSGVEFSVRTKHYGCKPRYITDIAMSDVRSHHPRNCPSEVQYCNGCDYMVIPAFFEDGLPAERVLAPAVPTSGGREVALGARLPPGHNCNLNV